MRRWKFFTMLTLVLGFGALGCGGGTAASTISIAISPTVASVITNTTQTFSAFVTGSSDQTATWTVTCPTGVTAPACGTIDTNGVYTAPKTVPTVTTNGTATITPTATITATAHADTTKTAPATVTILSGIAILITPATATVGTTENFTFTANVSNPGCVNTAGTTDCTAVTWSVPTTTCPTTTPNCEGKIDPNSGKYTAPGTVPTTGSSVTITATSVKDITVTATALVTVVTAVDPTLTLVSPPTAAAGSLFQDVYLTGTNFISTNNVSVQHGTQVTPLTTVGISSSVIRARIPDSVLAAPGVLQFSVARQTGTPQSCPVSGLSPCEIQVIGVRPAITGPTPDNIQQCASCALSFDVNGGFFGTSSSPAVSATFAGQLRSAQVTNARKMSVIIGGSSNMGDLSTPGLYPVAIQSVADPTKLAVTNIAVQPDYSTGASTISSKATLPAGLPGSTVAASPNDVAINPATGIAVVANTGANDVTLIDLTALSVVTPSICTSAVGAGGATMSTPCPASGPTSVAVDYVRNIALVLNTTSQTVAIVDLNTKTVTSVTPLFQTPPSDAATHPPTAVGINPLSGRALVTMQDRPYGLLLDVTRTPPAVIGPVTISTGAKSRVAVEPHLNWAIATPGGLGSIGIVDLNRQTVNNVTSLSRASSGTADVVTVTVQASTTAPPQPPLAVQIGDAVFIQHVTDTSGKSTDTSSFEGVFTVSGVGPSNGQFSYTLTGAPQPDETILSATGTVNYAPAVAIVELSNSFQGIGINPETQQAVLVDPSTSGFVSFLSLLDQTSSSLTLRGPGSGTTPGPVEPGSVAGTFNPLTNVAVTVNPRNNTLSVINPSPPPPLPPVRLTSTTSFPSVALSGPVAVAVDPGTNFAVVANQTNNTVSILSLGPIQPLSITETFPKTFVATSTLSNPAPPAVLQLTVIGVGFSSNSRVRFDGVQLNTTFVSDRKLTANVSSGTPGLPNLLTSPQRYAVDVLDTTSNAVTNTSDFTVTRSVDVSAACSTPPLPAGVAIDPVGVAGTAAVSLSGCTMVALIDLSTGVTTTKAVGSNPSGVAALPRLHIFVVANNGSNNASVVDEQKGSVTNITTGSGSLGVAADQDTGEAAVANSVANTVTVLNVATNGASSITGGQRPVAVAFDYQTHQVAVAADASDSVGIATAPSGSLSASFAVSVPLSVAYDPANNVFLAASSTGNSVTIYDPTLQQQVGSPFRVGINPTAIAYNYLTGTLISTNTLSHTITVADIVTSKIRAMMTLPPPPVDSTLGLFGALQFAVDIHPLTNLAVIADTANGRVLLVPLPR
jgi:DNA-binding beta-propeller fold protein YncE